MISPEEGAAFIVCTEDEGPDGMVVFRHALSCEQALSCEHALS